MYSYVNGSVEKKILQIFSCVYSGCLIKQKITFFIFGSMILLCTVSCRNTRESDQPISRFHGERDIHYYPKDYESPVPVTIQKKFEPFSVTLASRSFSQGEAVYFECDFVKGFKVNLLTVKTENKNIQVNQAKWGYRGFFAISPETKPGNHIIEINYSDSNQDKKEFIPYTVKAAHFTEVRKALDLGKFSDTTNKLSPELLAFIDECTKEKKEAFASSASDLLTSSFSHPRDMHYITSGFYLTRRYMRYRIVNGKRKRLADEVNIHKGLDLRGAEGSPVFVIASGKAVLARETYYEGNFAIINHGSGIFSYYMHMSKIFVKKNSFVEAGSIIGEVGSTGISNGPHLHVSLIIDGVQVDPLSFIMLPVRDVD